MTCVSDDLQLKISVTENVMCIFSYLFFVLSFHGLHLQKKRKFTFSISLNRNLFTPFLFINIKRFSQNNQEKGHSFILCYICKYVHWFFTSILWKLYSNFGTKIKTVTKRKQNYAWLCEESDSLVIVQEI